MENIEQHLVKSEREKEGEKTFSLDSVYSSNKIFQATEQILMFDAEGCENIIDGNFKVERKQV